MLESGHIDCYITQSKNSNEKAQGNEGLSTNVPDDKEYNAFNINDIENAIQIYENFYTDKRDHFTKINSMQNNANPDGFDEDYDDYDANLIQFNVSNRKYLPPTFSKKNYLVPKVFSASLSLKKNKSDTSLRALDFGISEMIQYKTAFPLSLSYSKVCQEEPPYLAPVLVSIMRELEKFVPPLYLLTAGSCQDTLEAADSLMNVLLKVNIKNNIPLHIENIFFLNVPIRVLTNALQIFFQRLQYPLFLTTTEFCKIVTSNQYDIKLVRFGCDNFSRDNPLIQALGRCLAISSNFQVANLAYFIEICQRWVREQIKCELDLHPMGFSELIYEDAVATITMIFGKTLIGIPKHFVARKIMDGSLPFIDDIRRTVFYFLLGIPSFEFWHLWSINTLCFEDERLKCKCKRGAFMDMSVADINLETQPII